MESELTKEEYQKKINRCKRLGAEWFQQIVFKVEKLKFNVLKNYFPNAKEKYEKTKQGLNAAGILAQAGLAFAGSTAGAMGYGNLSNAIGAGQSIWNAYELANSIDEKDNLGIMQNSIPLALYGAGIAKYIPRVNQMSGIDAISKIGNASGLVWDWLPNPIIEAFKIKRDRKIQK